MKIIFFGILTIFALFSCSSTENWQVKEAQKTQKSSAASSRIGNSESSSQQVFKELE